MIKSKRILFLSCCLLLAAAAGGGCTKSARSNRGVGRGDQFYAALDYDKAEAAYMQAARMVSPPNPSALRGLGLLYMDEGRPSVALWCLQQAAKAEPDNVKVQVALAVASQQSGFVADAKEAAERALKLQPGNERALLVLCEMAANAQETEQTRQYIEKLRQQDKERGSYELALGALDSKAGNLAKARDEYNKSAGLDPNSVFVHTALGSLESASGDAKGAEEEYKTAVDKAPLRSPARVLYAEFEYQHGETNQAIAGLQDLNSKAPDYIPAALLLMKLDFMEKKYDDCLTYINKILEPKRDPNNLEALLEKGSVYMAKGDGTEAAAAFEHVSELTAKHPAAQIQYQLARAYILSGARPKAIAALNGSLAIDTNYVPAKLSLSEMEVQDGDPGSAVKMLESVLATPRLPQELAASANLTLASAYTAQNLPAKAAALYRQLEVSFPKDPEIPFMNGRALEAGGQTGDARAAFERSLAIDPEFLPPLEALVDLDLVQSKFSDATVRVNKELDKYPTNAFAYVLKAKVLIATKDYPQAEAALQKSISLNPKVPGPYLLLTQIYVVNNKDKEALENLDHLLSITNDLSAMVQAAEIHDKDQQYDLARQTYEKVLASAPDSPTVLNNLAYLYSEHFNDQDKAAELAEKAHKLLPGEAAVTDTLAWILFKKGDYSHAASFDEESAAKLSQDPNVQYHLGMAHYMLGEEGPARDAFQIAAASNSFDKKDEVRERLAMLAVDPARATADERALVQKRLQSEPGDPVALARQAIFQEHDGDWQKAAASYETIVKQNPQNVRAVARLAQIYSARLNQPDRALQLAKNAHKLAPEDPSIAATLGRLVFQARDYAYSLSLLQDAARSLPGKPDLLHDLAWAYFSNGDADRARASMDSAVKTAVAFDKMDDAKQFLSMMDVCSNPSMAQAPALVEQVLRAETNYAPALMASGLVAEQQGHPQEAEQAYEKVLVIYPAFVRADRQLAILYSRDGNDAKSAAYADKARTAFPGDFELAKSSGIVAYRRKDYQGSSQYLTPIAGNTPEDAEVLYYLGMDQYQLKRSADSKKNLQRAVALKLPENLATNAARVITLLK